MSGNTRATIPVTFAPPGQIRLASDDVFFDFLLSVMGSGAAGARGIQESPPPRPKPQDKYSGPDDEVGLQRLPINGVGIHLRSKEEGSSPRENTFDNEISGHLAASVVAQGNKPCALAVATPKGPGLPVDEGLSQFFVSVRQNTSSLLLAKTTSWPVATDVATVATEVNSQISQVVAQNSTIS